MSDAPLATCTPTRGDRFNAVLVGLLVGLYALAVLSYTPVPAWTSSPVAALLGVGALVWRLRVVIRTHYWTVWPDRLVIGRGEVTEVRFVDVSVVFAGIPVPPRMTPDVWLSGITGRLRAQMALRRQALVLRLVDGRLVVFSATRPDQQPVWAALADRVAHLQAEPDALTPAEASALGGWRVLNRVLRPT